MKLLKHLITITLILAIIVCTGVSALSADVVKVDITGVSVPAVGEKLNSELTISTENESLYTEYLYVSWYYTAIEPADIYDAIDNGDFIAEPSIVTEPGYYTAEIILSTVDGYSFNEETIATINNLPAEVRLLYNNTNAAVYYTFPYVEDVDFTDISSVEIFDVEVPIVGASAKFTWNIPETAQYKKYFDPIYADEMFYGKDYDPAVYWVETLEKPTDREDIFAGNYYNYGSKLVFKENYYYTIVFEVETLQGFEFTNDTSFKINTNTAEHYFRNRFYAEVWYTFTPEPRKNVSSIVIDSVVPPVFGEYPCFDFTIEKGNGYSDNPYTQSDGVWYITETIPTCVEDLEKGELYLYHMSSEPGKKAFSDKYYYTFFVYIWEDGGVFQNDLTATINGKSAKLDLSSKNDGLVGVYYTFEKPTAPELPVNPSEDKFISIKLQKPPAKLRYKYGENLNTDGLVIEAVYESGKTAQLDASEIDFSGFDSSERGFKTVTASYGGASVSFDVEIYFTFWQWILYIVCFGWIWM